MYYRAPVLSKAHKTYFPKELNSAHRQTINTKGGKYKKGRVWLHDMKKPRLGLGGLQTGEAKRKKTN
jgi:hypothetical protein